MNVGQRVVVRTYEGEIGYRGIIRAIREDGRYDIEIDGIGEIAEGVPDVVVEEEGN